GPPTGGSPAEWRRVAAQGDAGVLLLITPTRVVDTRASGTGIVTTGYNPDGTAITAEPIQAGTVRRFKIGGAAFNQNPNPIAPLLNFAFPEDLRGILANVTIIQSSAGGGFVTVFPGSVGDTDRPLASTVNPSTAIAANFTVVAISPTGSAPGK